MYTVWAHENKKWTKISKSFTALASAVATAKACQSDFNELSMYTNQKRNYGVKNEAGDLILATTLATN